MTCKFCKSENLYKEYKQPYVGLFCSDCGKWQCWIKQKNPNVLLASKERGEIAKDILRRYIALPLTEVQAEDIINIFQELEKGWVEYDAGILSRAKGKATVKTKNQKRDRETRT